jgi:ADP-heptose:LPS heptosyltransferase
MLTASVSGKLGDVIWQLSALRGLLAFRHERMANITWTQKYPFFDVMRAAPLMDSLLRSQEYIDFVSAGKPYEFDLSYWWLDRFARGELDGAPWNLATLACDSLCVSSKWADTSWLTAEPKTVAKYVVSRNTQRVCVNELFPWQGVMDSIRKDSVFVGHKTEHQRFIHDFGPIDFHPTDTLLEAAEIISGSQAFIGNQSVQHALAQGLGKKVVLEVCRGFPSVLFPSALNVHREYVSPETVAAFASGASSGGTGGGHPVSDLAGVDKLA